MTLPSLLFVEHILPWPLTGGSQLLSYHCLQTLSRDWDIRLLSFIRDPAEANYGAALEPFCRRGVELIPLPRTAIGNALTAGATLLTGQSFLVQRDAAPEMATAVRRELATGCYRVLWVDHLQMAQFVPRDVGGARVVLNQHNVEYRIPQRIAETAGNPVMRAYARTEWPRLRRFEQEAIRNADLTIAVSEADAAALRDLVPERAHRIASVPIGIDTEYFAPVVRRESETLLSIGTMYWPPNVDAIHYFCREIYPRVKAGRKGVRLNVVGAKPAASVVALGREDDTVHVTGTVQDVRPFAEECAVFIVPLRSGSGMRVKILNALAMGLPVVSTTVGAEGIAVTHGRDILLADTPEAFAEAILKLIADPALGNRLGQEGRRLVEERYSWQVVGEQLRRVLAERLRSKSEGVTAA